MGPRLTIILGLLLLSGWGSGFKTKMCDHDKTVEATKKIYECMLESLMDGLKNGKIPITIDGHAGINYAIYLMSAKKSNRMTFSFFPWIPFFPSLMMKYLAFEHMTKGHILTCIPQTNGPRYLCYLIHK